LRKNNTLDKTPATMKISKSDALSVTFSHPKLRFEQQDLTSFSWLVLFQCLFARLGLYRRLARCFRHSVIRPIYPHARIILLHIAHTLLGFRYIRDSQQYADDPLVLRITGLKRMPSVSTISDNWLRWMRLLCVNTDHYAVNCCWIDWQFWTVRASHWTSMVLFWVPNAAPKGQPLASTMPRKANVDSWTPPPPHGSEVM
jgi:hypothetical protein